MDNKKAFFRIIDNINKEIVENEWVSYCEKVHNYYCLEAMKKLESGMILTEIDIKNPIILNNFINSYELKNGSPKSFDKYQIEWKRIPSHIDSFHEAKEWILKNHIKRSPAIAIIYENRTIIGGWVMYYKS